MTGSGVERRQSVLLSGLFWCNTEGSELENLSREAAQAGMAVEIARRLESALTAAGATGKGLHEKTTSVEGMLPAPAVRKLRFIASVRNKIVHEDTILSDAEFSAFTESGKLAMEELEAAIPKKARRKARARGKSPSRPASGADSGRFARTGTALRLAGLAVLGGTALVFLLMVLGTDGPWLWAGAFAIYFVFGWQVLRNIQKT
ncbi:MAG TPA: hypothetical protein VJ576_01585 [Rhodocyclaceae bacterium]|nr:hypothetical protein [Rhodocyclaceae bacterium]